MKKLLFASAFFLFLFFSITNNILAQEWLPCPSEEMDCPEFHSKDGCLYPCVGFATRVGCPESPGRCQCQIPIKAKTVPLGGRCQQAGNCTPPGKYCWGECNQAPTCHETESVTVTPVKVCDFAGAAKKQACETCMGKGDAAWTALGCIKTNPQQFIGEILKIAVGIGGGIAFLLILLGGFQILMSAGNPERLNAGKELVTSAITGLLIIIFSLFILRLIGFKIFAIPGFG